MCIENLAHEKEKEIMKPRSRDVARAKARTRIRREQSSNRIATVAHFV
jgi:hypothetical protein